MELENNLLRVYHDSLMKLFNLARNLSASISYSVIESKLGASLSNTIELTILIFSSNCI